MTNKKIASFACKKCGQEFALLSEVRAHNAIAHTAEANPALSHTAPRASAFQKWFPAAVLGVLTLLAIAQTIEVAKLRAMIAPGAVINPDNGASTTNLPSSLQNLPNMVGGC